jgi:hypothetical protein
MGYIVKVDTTSSTLPNKSVFICCSNRFRAMRAIKDTTDILREAPIERVKVAMMPTLLSDTVYRRLSLTMEARREQY